MMVSSTWAWILSGMWGALTKNKRQRKLKKRLRKRIKILKKTKKKNLKLNLKKRLRKKDKDSEENKDKEPEAQGEEEAQKKDKGSEEDETEKLEKEAEKEPKKTPTPPRGRTKAATARRSSHMGTPRMRLVLQWSDEADKYTVEEKQGWILTVCKSNDGASAVDETADEVSAVDETADEVPVVDEGVPSVDETADEVPAVDEGDPAVDETDEGARAVSGTDEGAHDVDETDERAPAVAVDGAEGLPAPTRVKHRHKAAAVRKNAPKLRGRPRKSTDPKKFATPEQTTRIRARSRWVSSPFTEADTDEIEGPKKKPRTEA
ncbi:unnamed protein product [Eruca vesicaria subsp. sativa]|uniref:Uncharacterized protein n=1 Tax=Eruca vesicaria subsp. sativa TaxID=29727 RepID=A0ABC8LF85_ERUVS|nr:unnamed protein product [Eruca vesicaria subsp. sativa]